MSANPNAFNISSNPNNDFGLGSPIIYWQTQPRNPSNDTGFITTTTAGTTAVDVSGSFFQVGSQIRFGDNSTVGTSTELTWRVVNSLINNGLPSNPLDLTETGPVELSDIVADDLYALDLIPNFRTAFDSAESTAIQTAINNQADFGIGYDIEANSNAGAWYVIDSPAPSGTEEFPDSYNASDSASWLIFC